MDLLYIEKKHVALKESPYSTVYVVALPKKSAYPGYEVSIPSTLVVDYEWYFGVRKPWWTSNFIFTLVKTVREPGKRYSRPKLTWDELCEVLRPYQEPFDVAAYPQALVAFNTYEFKGSTKENQDRVYAIGAIVGKWFIDESLERHRVSAATFKIIKEGLSQADVALYQEKINRMRVLDGQLSALLYRRRTVQDLTELKTRLNEWNASEAASAIDVLQKTYDEEIKKKEEEYKELCSFLEKK